MVKENIKINENITPLNIDVDINLEILKNEGITEKEIDSLFNAGNVYEKVNENSTPEKQRQDKIDKELVENFIANPTHELFNKLWERYYFGIKGYAYKFLKDWEYADDITCQTFTRAWEFKEKYDITKAKFSTWLYIICRNLCLGEINNKKKDNFIQNDISNMYDSTILKSRQVNTNNTQYVLDKNNKLIENTLDDLTFKMYDTSICELDKLGPLYSNILKMKLIQDMKIREIADILNMNESTVKNYLYKGKELLKNIMKNKHKNLYEMYIDTVNEDSMSSY
jgi:RNA polymerase sigma-70 factor (ECF subfamily)